MTDILINSWTKGVLESVGASTGGELLPCPFCGTGPSSDHNATQVQPYVSHGEWSIICEACQVESGVYLSKDDAVTAWNTRSLPLSDSLTNGGSGL